MKQIKFRGDHTGELHLGDVLGPDAGGVYHRVIAVRFEYPFTIAETRHIVATETQAAPQGRRIRYYGGVNNPPPPQHEPITDDTVEPQ